MRGVIVRPVPVRSIPNSTNTWEAIYDVPPMSDAEKNEVIENPFEVRAQPHTHIPGRHTCTHSCCLRMFAWAVGVADEARGGCGQSRSDSFYFVEDKLIMHTKAEYGYAQS